MPFFSRPKPDQARPIVVQIGFNKCATKSMTLLFAKSGYPALHCQREFTPSGGAPSSVAKPQRVIADNIKNGIPAFRGFEHISGFFDLELNSYQSRLENYKSFAEIHAAYPNAKFILNTRDKQAWIKSRRGHNDGVYLEKFKSAFNETEEQVIERWSRDFDEHHAAVRSHFAEFPGALLEYNIEKDTVDRIVEFVEPDFQLNTEFWGHHHKSK